MTTSFTVQYPASWLLLWLTQQLFRGITNTTLFNFVHANVNYIDVSVDGQSVPGQPLRPDFTTGDYTSSFLSMFFNHYPQNAGGNWITRTENASGYSLFCFDIQGEASEDIFGKVRKGFTKLQMSFGSATPNLMILLYSSFSGLVKIDKARNVILE